MAFPSSASAGSLTEWAQVLAPSEQHQNVRQSNLFTVVRNAFEQHVSTTVTDDQWDQLLGMFSRWQIGVLTPAPVAKKPKAKAHEEGVQLKSRGFKRILRAPPRDESDSDDGDTGSDHDVREDNQDDDDEDDDDDDDDDKSAEEDDDDADISTKASSTATATMARDHQLHAISSVRSRKNSKSARSRGASPSSADRGRKRNTPDVGSSNSSRDRRDQDKESAANQPKRSIALETPKGRPSQNPSRKRLGGRLDRLDVPSTKKFREPFEPRASKSSASSAHGFDPSDTLMSQMTGALDAQLRSNNVGMPSAKCELQKKTQKGKQRKSKRPFGYVDNDDNTDYDPTFEPKQVMGNRSKHKAAMAGFQIPRLSHSAVTTPEVVTLDVPLKSATCAQTTVVRLPSNARKRKIQPPSAVEKFRQLYTQPAKKSKRPIYSELSSDDSDSLDSLDIRNVPVETKSRKPPDSGHRIRSTSSATKPAATLPFSGFMKSSFPGPARSEPRPGTSKQYVNHGGRVIYEKHNDKQADENIDYDDNDDSDDDDDDDDVDKESNGGKQMVAKNVVHLFSGSEEESDTDDDGRNQAGHRTRHNSGKSSETRRGHGLKDAAGYSRQQQLVAGHGDSRTPQNASSRQPRQANDDDPQKSGYMPIIIVPQTDEWFDRALKDFIEHSIGPNNTIVSVSASAVVKKDSNPRSKMSSCVFVHTAQSVKERRLERMVYFDEVTKRNYFLRKMNVRKDDHRKITYTANFEQDWEIKRQQLIKHNLPILSDKYVSRFFEGEYNLRMAYLVLQTHTTPSKHHTVRNQYLIGGDSWAPFLDMLDDNKRVKSAGGNARRLVLAFPVPTDSRKTDSVDKPIDIVIVLHKARIDLKSKYSFARRYPTFKRIRDAFFSDDVSFHLIETQHPLERKDLMSSVKNWSGCHDKTMKPVKISTLRRGVNIMFEMPAMEKSGKTEATAGRMVNSSELEFGHKQGQVFYSKYSDLVTSM